jgi:hypothetical protein
VFEGDPVGFSKAMTEYAESLAVWTSERTVKAQLAEQERGRLERANTESTQRIASEFARRRTEALTRLPDYAEIAEADDHPVTPIMANAIMVAPNGPEVAYFLGRPENHAESARIAALPPGQQIFAIGELSGRLVTQAKGGGAEARPNPPPPIKPTGAGASGSTETERERLEKADMDEYATRRGYGPRGRVPGARAP